MPFTSNTYLTERHSGIWMQYFWGGLIHLNACVHLQALQSLEYPEKLQRLLLTPQREVLVELVITKGTAPCLAITRLWAASSQRMQDCDVLCSADNGEIETFNAYRVQHDDSRGPYKGGLRYHPQVDLDDVRRCSFCPLFFGEGQSQGWIVCHQGG